MVTAERVRDLLNYDPKIGIFTWKVARGGRLAGSVAGCSSTAGYVVIRLDWRLYGAHQLAWLYMTGEWPSFQIDHRNLNKANNSWTNLRHATHAQNEWNTTKRRNNSTGFKGVFRYGRNGRYRAQINIGGGRAQHLGCFDTPELAHAAYRAAAGNIHGSYARAA